MSESDPFEAFQLALDILFEAGIDQSLNSVLILTQLFKEENDD